MIDLAVQVTATQLSKKSYFLSLNKQNLNPVLLQNTKEYGTTESEHFAKRSEDLKFYIA